MTCGMSQTNITTYIELKMHKMNFRHFSASAWGDFFVERWHTHSECHKKKIPLFRSGRVCPCPFLTPSNTKGLDKNFLDVVYVEFHMGYAHHSDILKFPNFPTPSPSQKNIWTALKATVITKQCKAMHMMIKGSNRPFKWAFLPRKRESARPSPCYPSVIRLDWD